MSESTFYEKQYFGYNRFGLIRRIAVMLFCFIFYFITDDRDINRNIFFYLGVILLIISGATLLIPHMQTRISDSHLKLTGPTTFRKVNIDLSGISNVRIKPYSKLIMNRPMFNLHRSNGVRFYTHGKWSVVFDTEHGETYIIGTQKPDQLKDALLQFSS